MSGKLAPLKFDDPLFPLKLSEISESRLLQDEQQDELRMLLGYDRLEYEQPDIPIEDAVGSFSGIIYKAAAIAQSGLMNERPMFCLPFGVLRPHPRACISSQARRRR